MVPNAPGYDVLRVSIGALVTGFRDNQGESAEAGTPYGIKLTKDASRNIAYFKKVILPVRRRPSNSSW